MTGPQLKLSQRQKVILLFFLMQAFFIALWVVPVVREQHHLIEKQIEESSVAFAKLLAVQVNRFYRENNPDAALELLRSVDSEDYEYIALVGPDGTLEGSSDPTLTDEDLEREHISVHEKIGEVEFREVGPEPKGFFHARGHDFEVYAPIVADGERKGALRVGLSSKRRNRALMATSYKAALFSLTALAIGGIIGILIDRRMRRILRNLTHVTGRMAQGDFSLKVNIKTGDELETLGDSFNQMADALHRREQEIKYLRDYNEYVVNSITDGIVVVDRRMAITFWNDAMERITGLTRDRALKKDLVALFPKLRASGQENELKRALMGEVAAFENIATALSDRERIASEAWLPLRDSEGKIMGIVGRITDVTEKARLQNQLKQYAENLEQKVAERTRELRASQEKLIHSEKMGAIGKLSAGIAHEIGNPLTSISSLVQILQKKEESEEKIERLKTVQEHIQRISKIVRQMVDFARPPKLEWKIVDLNEAVRAAIRILEYDERRKKIEILDRLQAEPLPARLVEDQFVQVVMNLALNAVDAMPAGGKIELFSGQKDGWVYVSFKDTGEGMSEEDRKRVFEPFYTTKGVGKGVGLGLSVSYSIMKSFGGEIAVDSAQGHGSRFTLWLPRANEEKEGNA